MGLYHPLLARGQLLIWSQDFEGYRFERKWRKRAYSELRYHRGVDMAYLYFPSVREFLSRRDAGACSLWNVMLVRRTITVSS